MMSLLAAGPRVLCLTLPLLGATDMGGKVLFWPALPQASTTLSLNLEDASNDTFLQLLLLPAATAHAGDA